MGSGTALTNLNYNAISNPPTMISFNNPFTFESTLNVSENTPLNKVTIINSSLNVSVITTINNKTIVKGIFNVNNGAPHAVNNYTLNHGSLVIGDTLLNYGCGD
jgi:hypothetical protein